MIEVGGGVYLKMGKGSNCSDYENAALVTTQ